MKHAPWNHARPVAVAAVDTVVDMAAAAAAVVDMVAAVAAVVVKAAAVTVVVAVVVKAAAVATNTDISSDTRKSLFYRGFFCS